MIQFGKCIIGDGLETVIIAEAAVEHLGSVNVAKRLADAALENGANIIKFQMHLPDEEMLPGKIHMWGGSLDDILANNNLTVDDHARLIEHCEEIGIQYLCTPFCPQAVVILNQLEVEGFKTGSGELTNLPLFEEIVKTKKPVIVSTGMSLPDEIHETAVYLKSNKVKFALTNCTSIYPTPYKFVNLSQIDALRAEYCVPVGHSDHTSTIWTSIAAVARGANIIEKHFTLSRYTKGPDYEVSLEPHELKKMVEGIRAIEQAMIPRAKSIIAEEANVRSWAQHSIVSTQKIRKGQLLTRDNLSVKRPGNGIPAKELSTIFGKKALRDIVEKTQLQRQDFA